MRTKGPPSLRTKSLIILHVFGDSRIKDESSRSFPRLRPSVLNSYSIETEGFETRLGVPNSRFLQNMSLASDLLVDLNISPVVL